MTTKAASHRQRVNLLINLADSAGRLSSASGFLAAAGIAFQRIDAVDGRKTDLTRRPEYDAALARNRFNRDLSASEIGCFMSHRKALAAFLASNADFALVMEDDLDIPPGFAALLAQVTDWLVANHGGRWDLVNLGAEARKVLTPLADFPLPGGTTTLCAAHIFPLTTTALLWNRDGAERFIAASGTIYAPVDDFLKMWCLESDRGLAFDTPPVATIGAESTIDTSRVEMLAKTDRRGPVSFITRKFRYQRNKFRAKRNKARFMARR